MTFYASFKRTVCTLAILKINAFRLTLEFSWFVLLSQVLFVPCLFKYPTEKARVQWQAFIFKIIRVHHRMPYHYIINRNQLYSMFIWSTLFASHQHLDRQGFRLNTQGGGLQTGISGVFFWVLNFENLYF